MDNISDVFKALSDRNRLKVMCALEQGRLCACQITELLGLAPSTVSRHMEILEHAGLIESFKQQRWVYYELPGIDSNKPAGRILTMLSELFDEMEYAREVKGEIAAIKSISPEELCRMKREG